MSLFIQKLCVGGDGKKQTKPLFLVTSKQQFLKIFVQWLVFVVTALSCLCAALYWMLAANQLSHAVERQLLHRPNRTTLPASLCLTEIKEQQ